VSFDYGTLNVDSFIGVGLKFEKIDPKEAAIIKGLTKEVIRVWEKNGAKKVIISGKKYELREVK